MATAQSPLARQPDQLDYASPTQFRFGIHQLPKVEFFTVSANLPGISAGTATYATPFKDIPTMGEKLEYEKGRALILFSERLTTLEFQGAHKLNTEALNKIIFNTTA